MTIVPGQLIDGKYRVLRRIGEGGMGTVYEGVNVRIERRVAIKVLHQQIAQLPEFAQRFEREARAAARIGSPYVCDVLDLGDLPNGERFIVMEFLDGISLEERISRGPLSPEELAPIAFEILEGLGTMHHAGIVHRDLKPANIFLARIANRRADTVKILDFGIAKIGQRADDPAQMTGTGRMMGTPLYMSPEQARGAREVDGRSDLYSASVIFYRALTGRLPYDADTLNELLFKIVLEEPQPIREHLPDLDEGLAAVIMCGLARDREQRFPSARLYQEAIAAWGKRTGRPSLAFNLTLPTHGPGAAAPVASVAPPKATTAVLSASSKPVTPSGNPMPTLESARAGEGAPPGTPIAWSDSAPPVQGSGSGRPPGEGRLPVRTSAPPAGPLESRPPAPPRGGRGPRVAILAAVSLAALVTTILVAVRASRSGDRSTTTSSPASAEVSATPRDVAPSAPPSVELASPRPSMVPAPEAPEPAVSKASLPVMAAAAKKEPVKREPATTAAVRPSASASAAVPTTTPIPAATPTATATSGKRKFRTDID